jgi:hypothetical protein
MDSLRIGFFYDSRKRDHECTLLGLEDAYRRARSTSSQFRADAGSDGPRVGFGADLADEFTTFDAISLEPEFSRHPVLRESLFLLDSAVDFETYPWRNGEFDEVGFLPRVAALDMRPWSVLSVLFDRAVPILPAPMAPFRGPSGAQSRRVFVIINDFVLAERARVEVDAALRRAEPDIQAMEIVNPYQNPMRQSAWLSANLQTASAHLHIGFPADAASFGRLLDTMNMRVPCVVFEGKQGPHDADAPILWRRPAYEHDVNVVRVHSIKALAEAMRIVLKDPTWAQHLTRNALREVAIFQEQIQNSLLPTKYADSFLTAAS